MTKGQMQVEICPKKLRKPARESLQRSARNVVQFRVSDGMLAMLARGHAANVIWPAAVPIEGN